MTIIDKNLILSGGYSAAGVTQFQTVTGSAAVLSTNTIDLGTKRDMGEGDCMSLSVVVGTAFAGLTALDIEVIIADDAALTTNVESVGALKGVPVAKLTAGAAFECFVSPQIGSIGRRYLGARYTPTGTGTAGALFADLGDEVAQDGRKFYPSGITVA